MECAQVQLSDTYARPTEAWLLSSITLVRRLSLLEFNTEVGAALLMDNSVEPSVSERVAWESPTSPMLLECIDLGLINPRFRDEKEMIEF